MKKCISIMLIAIYGLCNLLGHAGLHVLMGDHCCDHTPEHNSLSQSSTNKNVESKCKHHCCHHHAGTEKNLAEDVSKEHEEPVEPREHDDKCQLGLYFAQSQLDIPFVSVVLQLFVLEEKVLVTSQKLALYHCFKYDARGPPAVSC